MIKLSWPDAPIEEHLRPTSAPLVVKTPAVPIEKNFLSGLRYTPNSRHLVIPSKSWSIAQPPSLIISDRSQDQTFLVDIVPKALDFVTQTYPISVLNDGAKSIFHGKTIDGHTIVCDNNGGVTALLSEGESTYQILDRDINC
ncbi:hypothetical protein FRB93_006781 [Tulasnella sp. JGI-2019a]|nr:hypothetical protein FRB93_006781 [Tulasnella sp. JGI-2019a]